MIFNVREVYNFTTLAPETLGANYTDMKVVLSGMLAEQAVALGTDVYGLHNTLKNEIPGLPDSPDDCTFVMFTSPNGLKIILAYEYIDLHSVNSISKTNIRLDIPNVSADMVSIITSTLKEIGLDDFKISTYV